MTRIIRCECGFVVEGTDDESLLANAQAHIADAHPQLVGKVEPESLLALAEVVA